MKGEKLFVKEKGFEKCPTELKEEFVKREKRLVEEYMKHERYDYALFGYYQVYRMVGEKILEEQQLKKIVEYLIEGKKGKAELKHAVPVVRFSRYQIAKEILEHIGLKEEAKGLAKLVEEEKKRYGELKRERFEEGFTPGFWYP